MIGAAKLITVYLRFFSRNRNEMLLFDILPGSFVVDWMQAG